MFSLEQIDAMKEKNVSSSKTINRKRKNRTTKRKKLKTYKK